MWDTFLTEKIVKENKFGRKFTDEERKLIAELYPTHTKKQMSEIIGKEITSGALQKIKRAFHIDTKPYDEGKKIIQEMGDEIKRLADEGWNNEDICKKLNIPLKTKYLFYKYIVGFSCGTYIKVNPEIRSDIIHDYSINLLSIFDIKKKYQLDTHGIQDILKAAGVLRNFRETYRLKREAGISKRKKSYTGKFSNKINPFFCRTLKKAIRKHFGNQCQICRANECLNGDRLHVHHIYPYSICKKNEYDNLIPLCEECHKYVHKQMSHRKELLPKIAEIYKTDMSKLKDFFLSAFNMS